MTPKELAALIDGREYRDEVPKELAEQAAEHGLVIVYGASDDLCEFEGAINDEDGCYGGGTIEFNRSGVISISDDDLEVLEKYGLADKMETASFEAKWGDEDSEANSWSYDVPFPHETFRIIEGDDENDIYCIGFVFKLDDALPQA